MSKIVFILLTTLLAYASGSVENLLCQYRVNGTADYDLLPFANISIPPIHYNDSVTVKFHLCNRKVPSCLKTDANVYAINNDTSGATGCQDLTSSTVLSDSPIPTFLDSSNATNGVVLTFPTYQSTYQGQTYNSTFIVNLGCDQTINASDIHWNLTVGGDLYHRTFTVTGAGKPGCPDITLQEFLDFFSHYKYIFGIIFFAIGLFSLLAGIKFFHITIFVFATTVVTIALSVLIFEMSSAEMAAGVQWVIFILCFLVGLGVGYAAVKVEKLGFFALGAFLGGLGALFLYSFLLHFFSLSNAALYVIVGLLGIVGGGLGLWLWKDIIILATSCIGSYLVVRGFSFFVGGFPNELDVAEGSAKFNYVAYLYLALMVVIAIGGMVFQYKKQKKDKQNEDEYHRESLVRQEYY